MFFSLLFPIGLNYVLGIIKIITYRQSLFCIVKSCLVTISHFIIVSIPLKYSDLVDGWFEDSNRCSNNRPFVKSNQCY